MIIDQCNVLTNYSNPHCMKSGAQKTRERPYIPYQDIIDNKKKNFFVGHMLAR